MNPKQKFVIAVIITATICGVIFLSIIMAGYQNKDLTEGGQKIIENTISALIAIVAMIIGNNVLKDK